MRTAPRRGFTLVEVMLALGILGMALVILVKSVAGNVTAAGESFYMGVATDLARVKMNELEEELLAEGFQETVQEEEGDFSDHGWPGVKWKALIEPAELPSYDKIAAIAQAGQNAEAEAADGEAPQDSAADKFQSSALGGLLASFGGGPSGGDPTDPSTANEATTGSFIQTFYPLIQQVLKDSIRKITLTILYDTGVRKEQFAVVLYVTDPAGMQKTLGALGL